MPHIKTKWRADRDAKIKNDEEKYRLEQFYMILLKADKAKLLSMSENAYEGNHEGKKAV